MNKAHILEEIRRTAEENSGVPLGRNRFETETGIKDTDWYGKFWARWGDAVREAGFSPNQLTGAYDKNELLNKYAKLALELGRLPSSGDLRLKTRNDEEFPSNSTFENRFVSKLELIRQLLEYTRGHSEFQSLVKQCEDYISLNSNISEVSQIVEGEIGFVYLIKAGRFTKLAEPIPPEDENMK